MSSSRSSRSDVAARSSDSVKAAVARSGPPASPRQVLERPSTDSPDVCSPTRVPALGAVTLMTVITSETQRRAALVGLIQATQSAWLSLSRPSRRHYVLRPTTAGHGLPARHGVWRKSFSFQPLN